MCVAVPLRVVEVTQGPLGASAVVDVGGVRQEVSLAVCDREPHVGEFVLVHAGFAIHVIPEDAGRESLKLLAQAAGLEGDDGDAG